MKLWMKSMAMLTVAGTLTLASCTEDDTPVVDTNSAPTITISAADGSVIGDTVMIDNLGELDSFQVVVSDAEGLNDILITRDGVSVSAGGSDVFINEVGAGGIVSVNAELLSAGDDSLGFTRTYYLRASADALTAVEYTFTVTDQAVGTAASETATATVVLMTGQPQTPIVNTQMDGLFFNASGPFNGAFDLDANEQRPSNVDDSELQDAGIDSSGTGGWRRVIIGENGASIRELSADDAATFSYDGLQFQEEIQSLYDNGTTPMNNRIGPLTDGSYFVVNRGNAYWIVEVEDVSDNPDNNEDGYTINYKVAVF